MLMTLTANAATKTGKSFGDVSKLMQQAMNGDIAAAKELGITIRDTGRKSKNALAIMAAAQAEYNTAAESSVSPWARVTAVLNNLYSHIGEKLLPYFNKLCTYVGDFVTGLLTSEDGQRSIESLCEWVKKLSAFFVEAARVAAGAFDTVVGSVSTAINGVYSVIAGTMEKLVSGAAWVADKIGADDTAAKLKEISAAAKEFSIAAAGQSVGAWQDTKAAAGRVMTAGPSDTVKTITKYADRGREQREAELAALRTETRATRYQGSRNIEEERLDKIAQEQRRRRGRVFKTRGEGQQIRVSVVSTRPQRLIGY